MRLFACIVFFRLVARIALGVSDRALPCEVRYEAAHQAIRTGLASDVSRALSERLIEHDQPGLAKPSGLQRRLTRRGTL